MTRYLLLAAIVWLVREVRRLRQDSAEATAELRGRFIALDESLEDGPDVGDEVDLTGAPVRLAVLDRTAGRANPEWN